MREDLNPLQGMLEIHEGVRYIVQISSNWKVSWYGGVRWLTWQGDHLCHVELRISSARLGGVLIKMIHDVNEAMPP